MRLDDLLVEKRLANNRKDAQAIILTGVVLVDEQRLDKPGIRLSPESAIRLKTKPPKYVSRGGLKLEAALARFEVPVEGKICLDLGASTGGFTDCLLQHAARKVYAFDVGRGQLHWRLRQHSQVIVCDRINVRYLSPSMVKERVDLVTVDLSFISLRRILPRLQPFRPVEIVALVKPPFEAARHEVEKGGLIGSSAKQQEIVARVESFAITEGFTVKDTIPSPILGQKGNREYFLWLI